MTQGGDCRLSWQTADFFTISQRKTAENSTPDVRDWSGIEPCSIPGSRDWKGAGIPGSRDPGSRDWIP